MEEEVVGAETRTDDTYWHVRLYRTSEWYRRLFVDLWIYERIGANCGDKGE